MKKVPVVVARVLMFNPLLVEKKSSSQQFSDIKILVADEQAQTDLLLTECLQSEIPLINQLSQHIIQSGGKRLRPLLVLLTAKAFGYNGYSPIQLAAIIELLHTATLLHDDVVDGSELRRGKTTANAIWGNNASVLVGDYLYSRAFQLMVQLDDMQIMSLLAQATNKMAIGEVMQLVNCHEPDTTEENYMQVIRHKTGTLFAAAAQVSAVLAKRSPVEIEHMRCYGSYLGSAFQLVDDALDYSASSEQMGKNMGDDLSEGKPTLPLIRALQQTTSHSAELIRTAIRESSLTHLDEIIKIIHSTDAIIYTYNIAKHEAAQALSHLKHIPPSPYRDGLMNLVEFAITRHY